MAKKCLNCGNISDNKLYACSECLSIVNEARRGVGLKKNFTKTSLLKANRIAPLLAASISLLWLATPILFLMRLSPPPAIFLKIFYYPALINFLICLLLGITMSKYCAKYFLGLCSDRSYYIQGLGGRIKNKKFLKMSLYFLLQWVFYVLLFWLITTGIAFFTEPRFKLRGIESFLRFRESFMGVVGLSGFWFGLLFSMGRFCDWVKGLEK